MCAVSVLCIETLHWVYNNFVKVRCNNGSLTFCSQINVCSFRPFFSHLLSTIKVYHASTTFLVRGGGRKIRLKEINFAFCKLFVTILFGFTNWKSVIKASINQCYIDTTCNFLCLHFYNVEKILQQFQFFFQLKVNHVPMKNV